MLQVRPKGKHYRLKKNHGKLIKVVVDVIVFVLSRLMRPCGQSSNLLKMRAALRNHCCLSGETG